MEYADRLDVELVLIGDTIGSNHCFRINHNREYAIDDAYSAADLVTYPSGYEGFGNAFVEAMYFKKPIVVNRYAIFVEDIEPMGFHVIDFDAFVTHQTVERIQHFLDPEIQGNWLEENYRIGRNRFSYEVLESKLIRLIESFD
jgi:glycosyltransferase involved in cell wall biosynthesis